MYEYRERIRAPRTVEFITPTLRGHRIVEIYLGEDIRITAYNESDCQRSPALLFMSEIEILIERAKSLTGRTTNEN